MKNSHSYFSNIKNTAKKTLSVFFAFAMLLTAGPIASAASLTISGSLAENTLNGANVSITLTDDTFLDATLSNGNFVLNNAPTGVSISSVSYTGPTTANLTLAYNNTDFDTNVTNFNITINAAELMGNANLTSNDLTITAVVEASPALTISGSLSESNLNSASLSISLANETFKDGTLNKDNFSLNNAPSGTIVSAVSYGSSTSATLSFSFNNTDFDSNITNFNITISASELTGNVNLTSNNLTITAVQEGPVATISGSLSETNLNGASVSLSLANDTFKDSSLDKSNFTLSNVPSGTTVSSVSYGNSTSATLTLAFNGTDFDSNVTNFTVIVGSAELNSNSSVISNALTITAVQEGSDTTKPTISSVSVDGTKKIVTLTMAENIDRVGSLSDLKSKIRFASDGSDFNSLESGDSVADINGSDKKLIITFGTAISGSSNKIRILSGAIEDAAGNQNVELTTSAFSSSGTSGTDTTKPTIDEVTVDHTLKVVTIVFTEDIERAASSLTSLKSKIKFASDGSDFESLSDDDEVSDPDGDDEKLVITFDDEISGTKNKIRIEADAIKDLSGNKNVELTTSAFEDEDTEAPYIKSATIDSAKKVVTINFQEDIDKADSLSTLKNRIKLAENGTDFESLSSDDEVSDLDGSDNILKITFDEALSGSKNKIKILSGAVEDENGNKNAELITNSLTTGSSLPTISSVTVSTNNRTVTITFSETVDRTASLSALKESIEFAPDGSDFDELSDDDEVSDVSGKTMTITFDEELSGEKNKIRIAEGILEDDDGNENDEITSPAFAAKSSDSVAPTVDDIEINSTATKITLIFTENISQTGSLTDLKSKIKLAKDGVNFAALSSGDAVSELDGDGNDLVIILAKALSGNQNRIKILADAVEDDAGNANDEFKSSPLALASDDTPFLDIDGHWAEEYISEIYDLGIVEGRDSSHYDPDENLNRAELAKIALMAFDIDVPESITKSPFLDIDPDAWYAVFIDAAKKAGIVGGYSSGFYYPEREISRVEGLKILLEASGLDIGNGKTVFTDTESNAWYQKYLAFAEKNGIVEGYEDGSFGPANPITRAEIAKILLLILQKSQ